MKKNPRINPTEETPIAVLIVDDHFVVRSGLAASLNLADRIRVVAEASCGEEAIASYRELRPNVVIMDLQLPGMDGIACTAALLEIDPEAKILIFSTFARQDEIDSAIKAGALGYLQKSASRDELLQALRNVATGAMHRTKELAEALSSLRGAPAVTQRERGILELIAAGRANKEIAAALDISEDTVKRHVTHILQKLDVHDRAQAVVEAIKRGIVKLS